MGDWEGERRMCLRSVCHLVLNRKLTWSCQKEKAGKSFPFIGGKRKSCAWSILIFKLRKETKFTLPKKVLFTECREWIWHEEWTHSHDCCLYCVSPWRFSSSYDTIFWKGSREAVMGSGVSDPCVMRVYCAWWTQTIVGKRAQQEHWRTA